VHAPLYLDLSQTAMAVTLFGGLLESLGNVGSVQSGCPRMRPPIAHNTHSTQNWLGGRFLGGRFVIG
jgi:hypothetical protein